MKILDKLKSVTANFLGSLYLDYEKSYVRKVVDKAIRGGIAAVVSLPIPLILGIPPGQWFLLVWATFVSGVDETLQSVVDDNLELVDK